MSKNATQVPFALRHLGPGDVPLLCAMNGLFGKVFGEPETYTGKRPNMTYLKSLLIKDRSSWCRRLRKGGLWVD
jgi:hypothetical protein